MIEFNFSNAFMHFARAGAPPGFFWKYFASYIAVSVGVALASFFVFSDLSDLSVSAIIGLSGFYLITIIISAVFEASWQRRYTRGDVFRLSVGRDELNVFVVYLIWAVFFAAMYFAIALSIVVVTSILAQVSSGLAGVLIFVFIVAGGGLWIFWTVRLSAASALTIRDGRIRFMASWRVTRGRFWTLFGSQIVMLLALLVISIIIFGVLGIMALLDVSTASDPNSYTLFNMVSEAEGLAAAIFVILGFLATYVGTAWWFVVWGGPAALAARTDPERANMDDPALAFQ
ncbi:MAG: hypothetical protein AAF683_02910 [Pseudomonadota bacterium]